MSVALFTDGEVTVQRSVDSDVTLTPTHPDDLDTVYDIQRSVTWLKDGNYKKVALQLPDEMLVDAMVISRRLETSAGVEVCVLADTAYNSCCVDETAAEHYGNVDSVIHYGHACLSPTRRLPVLYVFGHGLIDTSHCAAQIIHLVADCNTKLLLIAHVTYQHALGDIAELLKVNLSNLVMSEPHYGAESLPEKTGTTAHIKFGRVFHLPERSDVKDYTVVYIGPVTQTLVNFMMVLSGCSFISYDPNSRTCRKENVNVNKLLMKRYYLVERARDAACVGILVGTLAVSDYLVMLDRLKRMLRLAGKRTYTFVVGKLNVAKLANFPEVDMYVNVACAENTLIGSEQEFYQPIVTPYEMELACMESRQWTGEVILDFADLLPDGGAYLPLDESECSSERVDVSLVSGNIRRLGLRQEDYQLMKQETALVPVNTDRAPVPQVTGDVLESRSWKGLASDHIETDVGKSVEGRHGVAAGYTHEAQS